jgi:hypothetical protein
MITQLRARSAVLFRQWQLQMRMRGTIVADPVQTKTYRFRKLKTLGDMTMKIKQDRDFDIALLDQGICAALSMQWLQMHVYGLTRSDKKTTSEIQRKWESLNRARGTVPAVKILAEAMGLQFATSPLFCSQQTEPAAAAQYWATHGYHGANLSDKILQVAHELRKDLPPGTSRMAFLSFKIILKSIDDIPFDTIRSEVDSHREEWLGSGDANMLKMVDFVTNYKDGSHAIGLVALDQGIILCDANCGVYQIEWGKETAFFDEYQACYATFGTEPDGPDLVQETDLTGIFMIAPKATEASTASPQADTTSGKPGDANRLEPAG